MKTIVARIRRGKTLNYLSAVIFALVVGAAMPSFAADRVVSGSYQLTANEDWSGGTVTLEADATVDLAGFKLVLGIPTLTDTATFTDTSADAPGELRFTIPESVTFAKTASLAISGNLSLVKDGPGTLSWNGGTLDAAIPITVSNGIFKLGVKTANVFGSSGTITVNGTGQFDLNYSVENGNSPVRNKTFYIEGNGPDGSGAIVNNAASNLYGKHLEHVVMTGDATIGGTSRIDFRGDGCGIDGTGYTLTIKNPNNVVLADGTTHLNCARLVVADNGVFQPCAAYVSKKKKNCVLTIPDGIILENGGKFASWAHDSNNTPEYSTPIFVREGSGTISSSKNLYMLSGAITVQSGTTLNCTKDGTWYDGAITNETDATLNISGEFSACGGIFRNDGTVNHTAAKFVLGHRDNANAPCAVENNGTIKTTGGTFIFKAESSMTGTGTLDLAGGSPSVAGDLSGFTGTLRVSGGTASLSSIGNFGGTLVLANGTVSTSLSGVTCPVVFDLSGKTAPFTIPESWLTLPASKQVTIDLRGRTMVWGEKLLSWESAPSLAFSLAEGSTPLVEKADGLYFGDGDIVPVSATWTGAANNGLFSDVANWTCLDENKDPVSAFPAASTVITLGADVPQGGWATFDLEHQTGTIDLNGHYVVLQPASGNSPAFTITDTSLDTSHPGELRFTIPENETFEKTAALGISGNLSLVKDGPGTFLWSHDAESALSAAIPVLVTNGVFKIGATTGNLFGAGGTVAVKAPGQFDINTVRQKGPVRARTFYIEGDGPDGSGAIVNSAANTTVGRQLNKIVLTGDATIGGRGYIELRDSGNGIDCGGYELTVKNTGRLLVEAGTYLTNATDIVISGGTLQVCNSCVLGAERIVLENGGTFLNFMSSGTKGYNVPFVVREGTGTIKSSKYFYHIYSPVTVESGCTLNLPTDGPWYDGAITNKTDATLNISGEFNARSSFVNNGFVNHTADDFRLGGRNETAHPCAVENNGTIKTSGGTFQFKAESSMTGTGTLELAGGSPSVAGALSGFTGTIRVSGATATINNIATFPGTLVLADGVVSTSLASVTCGVVFDISDKTEIFAVPGSWLTLPSGSEVLVDVGERELQYGDRLLSWTTAPSNVRFKLLGEHKGVLRKDATGVVYEKPKGTVIIFR